MHHRKVGHHLSYMCNGPALEPKEMSVYVLDYSKGFGGKYGVEKDKVDKAALGFDYKGQTEKHQSQKGELN